MVGKLELGVLGQEPDWVERVEGNSGEVRLHRDMIGWEKQGTDVWVLTT